MAWLQSARDSFHKTSFPHHTKDRPARCRPAGTAAALAALLALASCTAPPPSPPSGAAAPETPASRGQGGSPTTAAPPPASTAPKTADRKRGTAPLGWGPQQRDLDAASGAVAGMTLAQKAGQVLLPSYAGLDPRTQAATVERLHLAGSMIMGENVAGAPRRAGRRAGAGRRDPAAGRGVAVRRTHLARPDRRGPGRGVVSRVGAPLTGWPSPMSYGAAGSVPLATQAGTGLAAELAALGFTVDFAPDADATIGPADPTIGARSMSADPRAAGILSVGFSKGMLAAGVLPVAKHFPGHGSVTADSHKDMPVQKATVAQLKARDWKPFQAAVAAGSPMIMTGHIAVPALEPGVPASISKATYAALRGMGFKGVAVTDALNMGAVSGRYPHDSAAPAALAAGADLLLMPVDVNAAHSAIVNAVGAGTLPLPRLDEAARRVVTMMIWQGRTKPHHAPAAPGSGEAVSANVSARAVTVLAGRCRGPHLAGRVRVAGGTAGDRARFAAAATAQGVTLGAGPLVSLIGYGGSPAGGDIAVALDAPWPLAGSAAPTKIALYGRTPGAFKALLAVLAGKAAATGKLPAAVGPYRPGSGCR
ncbi:glycoside hydrolase family 3 N-terminal domain-containing protein [Arthrobacter sp. KBS0703]|uniref:glycoside hydrolase family 3 N-terminal domain-containing protein n=1 Tax=Arthrobacter sp. KBS0703 TaxID=1955698 RepID=UPI00163D7990|nr:glycoside hydrolase family 3 N-terminal domain-containing protein [Arthrobacter sp. KBS0703]